MKNTIRFITCCLVALSTFALLSINSIEAAFAQSPQKFNYQGVARGSSGNALANKTLGFKLSILQGSSAGTAVYEETQSVTSDSKGIFSLEVGGGTVVSGAFSAINWGGNSYWLKTEMDTAGATNYQTMGSAQMISVPYALYAGNGNPVGTIISYAGATTPTGYLLCDGSAVSRTTYANLFAALGTAWGQGDGTTTFNLPDLRGQFMRGVDGAAGNDPDKATRTASNPGGNTGNNVGSVQTDNFSSHSHTLLISANISGNPAGTTSILSDAGGGGGSGNWTSSGAINNTASILSTGGNETRPKNVYVNYIIKY